ncbi:MAG TPA: hypothetical protein VGP20_01275, partial [Steroidobacteraceae bacterium]|nr:hypothetical protein [Steroidobacteraceae bacterium]
MLAVGSWSAGVALAADSVVFLRHIDPSATDQIIVKWRDSGVAAVQLASIEERTVRLRSTTGADVQPVHTLYGQIDVLKIQRAVSP